MATLRCQKLGSMLVALAVASASLLLVSAAAKAADVGLFRMKRTWWGGTSTAADADPYISVDFDPNVRGPHKAPPAEVYVGFETTVSGAKQQTVPRFTVPSKILGSDTYTFMCDAPGQWKCSPGYPASSGWYSYWNLAGRFQPNNQRFGGAASPVTVRFPTTGARTGSGHIIPTTTVPDPGTATTPTENAEIREIPRNLGNPAKVQGGPESGTTTPCVGGGLTSGTPPHFNCGSFIYSTAGATANEAYYQAGEPARFVAGAYDFSRAGSIMITPGKNRFGGTMHFFYGANQAYYQKVTSVTGYLSKAWGPLQDLRDLDANTVVGDVSFGGPFVRMRYTSQGVARKTLGVTENGGPGDDYAIRIPYFYSINPFTTGRVSVWVPEGDTNTFFTHTGYDNRTPDGLSGVVSLVRPRMVHVYKILPDPNSVIEMIGAWGGAWQMDFHFLPEPGSTVMMASGLVLLAGLYRLRRR
jgi:hypothetical protein